MSETDASEQEALAKSEMTHAIQRSARVASLSDSIDVLYHNIEWNIYPGDGEISGNVRTEFKVFSHSISHVYFDLSSSLIVDSVLYLGAPVTFLHGNEILDIDLNGTLAANSIANVDVFYHGSPTDAFITDFHAGTPEAWSISEPYGAREWWPCKDQLNDKIDSIEKALNSLNRL